MRSRSLPLILLALILASVLLVAGCSSEEAAAPAASGEAATAAGSAVQEAGGYTTVDVQTAYDALIAGDGAQIVDVREPSEWAETGVPQGAVLIPLAEVESRASSELVAEKPVYVICRSGNRSRTASETLVGLGFEQVYNVDGGFTAWLEAGLPSEAYAP